MVDLHKMQEAQQREAAASAQKCAQKELDEPQRTAMLRLTSRERGMIEKTITQTASCTQLPDCISNCHRLVQSAPCHTIRAECNVWNLLPPEMMFSKAAHSQLYLLDAHHHDGI